MKNVQERFEALKSMNTIIRLMNDENAYSSWIWIVPDGADDDNLMDIAKTTTISLMTLARSSSRLWKSVLNMACTLMVKPIKKQVKQMGV